MYPVDGNAFGGLLLEIFGTEMTSAIGTCAHCGNVAPVADGVVYLRAPGSIMRCRTCTATLMIVVKRRDTNCVDLLGLASLVPAGA
jgi:hypothetical protein